MAEQIGPMARTPYQRPRLIDLGTVAALTRGGFEQGLVDCDFELDPECAPINLPGDGVSN